jgi:hypothetical protein
LYYVRAILKALLDVELLAARLLPRAVTSGMSGTKTVETIAKIL